MSHIEAKIIVEEREKQLVDGIELFDGIILRRISKEDIKLLQPKLYFTPSFKLPINIFILEKILSIDDRFETSKGMFDIILALRLLHEGYVSDGEAIYFKARLIKKGSSKRYQLRAHSLRKYFRTQLGAISTIPTDYIKYMMGHTISTYNDIQMKGIEHLRNLYASSGLSIKLKTKITKLERIKMFVESMGLNPNEVLSKDALAMPNRTIVDCEQREIEVLNQALKQAILKELRQ